MGRSGAISPLNSRLLALIGNSTSLGGPGEVGDWDDEEAVAVIGDTSKSIVPSDEGSQDTKDTTSRDKFLLWSEFGWLVGGSEVAGT